MNFFLNMVNVSNIEKLLHIVSVYYLFNEIGNELLLFLNWFSNWLYSVCVTFLDFVKYQWCAIYLAN